MVDARSGSNVLFLPFDKLMQQVVSEAGQTARVVPAPPTSTAPEQVPGDARARDGARSRERETR
jgi:membrane protease subunit HflK